MLPPDFIHGATKPPAMPSRRAFLASATAAATALAGCTVDDQLDACRGDDTVVELGGLTRVEQRGIFAALTHRLGSVPMFSRACDCPLAVHPPARDLAATSPSPRFCTSRPTGRV
jgi:hypothetical protein